jgi:hypothetical protein
MALLHIPNHSEKHKSVPEDVGYERPRSIRASQRSHGLFATGYFEVVLTLLNTL